MKFYIVNNGDRTVGIDGFEVETNLPNIGYDKEEWIEICKHFLNDLYNMDTKGDVYTEEEYNEFIKEEA